MRRSSRALSRAHLDAEVPAECGESSTKARADGIELPVPLVAVDLPDDDRRLHGEIAAQLIAQQLRAAFRIDEANVRARDLPEVLPPLLRLVDRRCEREFLNLRRQGGKIDLHLLPIAARSAVPMLDRARPMARIPVEYEVLIARCSAVCAKQEDGGIDLGGCARLPSHADTHAAKIRPLLGEVCFLSLVDALHTNPPFHIQRKRR